MPLTLAHDVYETSSETARQATPLLIAHGLLGSRRNWATLAKRFAEHRMVATVDLRNHGESPRADSMAYGAMGEDLLAAAEALFGRPALLLGHSMGGKCAMAAALTAPSRVAGLIIADIAPAAYDHPEHGRIVAALRSVDLATLTKRSDAEPQIAEAIPEPSLRAFLLANLAFTSTQSGRRAHWRAALEEIAANIDLVTGWPEPLAQSSYDGPAFFLHGGASDYVGAAEREAIRRAFPRAEIETMPDAGHWLHAERPDAFYARVADRLAALSA
ncbi:MAG: alpha/beta fold hydrolase [Pseudomonadota bacterium]